MCFGHHVASPRWCYSTENYKEYTNNYHNINDNEKFNADCFYLPHCDDCREYIEFTNNICSQHLSQRISVRCNFFQNVFETFNTREVRCSAWCRSINVI